MESCKMEENLAVKVQRMKFRACVYVFNWNFFNFEFYLYLFRVLVYRKIEFTWYQYMKYMSDMIWLKKKNSLFEY